MEKNTTKPKVFLTKVAAENDLELYELFIHLYCVGKQMSGKMALLPRKALITLLAMYLKTGFNDETKELAMDVLGIARKEMINSLNHDLVKEGLLVSGRVSKKDKEVCDDLKEIRDYIKNGNNDSGLFFFSFKVKQQE